MRLLLGERAKSPEHVLLSRGIRLLRLFLFLAASVLLLLAIARPAWGERLLPASGKGRDLMLVFDVSKSMLCKDVAPSRLEHAKWFTRQLVRKTLSDRYGIVAFSGSAFLECPLTSDRSSLFQMTDELNPGSIPLGGTNIQAALEKALDAFSAAESGHRAIILITDGDELYGDSSSVLAKLKEKNIPLFVVGVGDPSQPGLISVPDEDGNGVKNLRDSKGELVKSRLNESLLAGLAAKAGGVYVRSTSTESGLPQIEDCIRKLIPKEYESGQQTRPIERFTYPLLAAFFLLITWLLLSERKIPGFASNGLCSASLIICAVSLLALAVSPSVSAGEPAETQEEEKAPVTGSGSSEMSFKELVSQLDPVKSYNKGWEAQQKKDNAAAARAYEDAINLAVRRPDVRAGAYQNYGVIRHEDARQEFGKAQNLLKEQKLDDAMKSLDSCLKTLDQAEGHYREALRLPDLAKGQPVQNQQLLLDDRGSAEKLKKDIEELKKQQEKARQETQQAKNQQQKENQKQKEQKQDKKGEKQEQKKEEEKPRQDSSNSQESNAQQETKDAQKAVQDLQQKAKDLGQQDLEKKAAAAEKELDKAAEKQREHDGKKAEEHINNALKQLETAEGKEGKDKKPPQDNKGTQKEDKEKQDKKAAPGDGEQGQPKEQSPKEEKELDMGQANALLDLMANEEKNFREAVKERDRMNSTIKKVEKDW